jgi:hypothetical protein
MLLRINAPVLGRKFNDLVEVGEDEGLQILLDYPVQVTQVHRFVQDEIPPADPEDEIPPAPPADEETTDVSSGTRRERNR